MKHFSIMFGTLVTLITLTVALGWKFNIPSLTNWHDAWVTQKAATCVAFAFQITSYWFFVFAKNMRRDSAIIGMAILTMSVLCAALLSDNPMGADTDRAVLSNRPGEPSLGTFFTFTVICAVSILSISNYKNRKIVCIGLLGAVMGAMFLVAVGFITHDPLLMFYVPGYSAAISAPTGVSFVALSCAWMYIIKEPNSEYSKFDVLPIMRPGLLLGAASSMFIISLLNNLRIVNHRYIKDLSYQEYVNQRTTEEKNRDEYRGNFLKTLDIQAHFIEEASKGEIEAEQYVKAIMDFLDSNKLDEQNME